jgi:hypothetical protein
LTVADALADIGAPEIAVAPATLVSLTFGWVASVPPLTSVFTALAVICARLVANCASTSLPTSVSVSTPDPDPSEVRIEFAADLLIDAASVALFFVDDVVVDAVVALLVLVLLIVAMMLS